MMAAKYSDNDDNQHNQRFSDLDQESCEMLMPIQGYENQPLVSLEQAVEPIVSLVPDVKRMAYVAKRKCKKTPANHLSIDESASIILYSMEWEPQEQCLYHVLNKTLRTENRKKLKPWFLYLKLILTALSRLPPSHRFVFRGIRRDLRKDYPEGETVYWWGFSSCTTKANVLQNEDYLGTTGKRTIFTIECFSGKDIREHSNFEYEAEILLLPGRQFEVVSCLDQGNNLCLIQLKEVEPAFPLLAPVSEDSHQMPNANSTQSTVKTTDKRTLELTSVQQKASIVPNQSVQPKQEISVNKKTPIVTQLEKLSLRVDPGSSPKQEINILLLGITGVGKSTFINVLANYLLNDTLEEATHEKLQVLIPFSFGFAEPGTFDQKMIEIGKQDEYENRTDLGESCTKKCRSFVFSIGDRLLRLIDTPPVGDTRGFEHDIKNLDEIITYIARYEYLNGICIFLKTNEELLTVTLRHCVTGLLRHLPKSAMSNIMFVFTNARSTFCMPGSTARILQILLGQYQQEHGVQIPFTQQNTFLVDNEAVRYLALHHNGVRLDDKHTQSYITSWDHTVKEYARLIAHINTRPLHTVRDTVSLYQVQQLISILTPPIVRTFQYIEQAIQLAKEYKKTTTRHSQSFSKTKSQNDVQILFLDHPRLVCTNPKCTGFTNMNGLQMIEYKSICYDRCYFTGNAIGDKNHESIKACVVMDPKTGKCTKCHCSWNEHMIIAYEYERTLADYESCEKEYEKTNKISRLDQIDKYISHTLDEQAKIEDVYRKLCKFLQINAIVPYNEHIVEYIRYFILEEQMKQKAGANNTEVIHHLEMLCSNYENEINLLKKTIEDERRSGNKTDLIEATDIFPLVSTLYDLPINGRNIRKQVEESKINPNKIEKRENFVKLPAKAHSSKLTRQLKDYMSKS